MELITLNCVKNSNNVKTPKINSACFYFLVLCPALWRYDRHTDHQSLCILIINNNALRYIIYCVKNSLELKTQ